MNAFRNLILSSLRKEMHQRLAFRWSIIFEIVSTATMLGVFFLIDHFHGHLFGDRMNEALGRLNTSYFGYVTLGLAVAALSSVGLSGLLSQMHGERAVNSLEYIMASPVSIQRWALVAGVCNLVQAFVRFALIFGVAIFVLRLQVPRFDAVASVVVLMVAYVPLWCLAVLTLSAALVFRRGDPLGFVLGIAFELLGGVYVPVDVLPAPLRFLAEGLPITPAVRAMQEIVYHGAGLGGASHDIFQLLVLTALYLPLAMLALHAADNRSRRKGYYCLS